MNRKGTRYDGKSEGMMFDGVGIVDWLCRFDLGKAVAVWMWYGVRLCLCKGRLGLVGMENVCEGI